MAEGEIAIKRTPRAEKKGTISFRHPNKADGKAISGLIATSAPLDRNSLYCNLLQCTHFAHTCMLAERDGEIVGWVSGYHTPDDPDVLFIWQVAVSTSARGEGLGKRLLKALLESGANKDVRRIKTSITEPNKASWSLFKSIAKEYDAPLADEEWFEKGRDLSDASDSERLVTIGPLARA